MMSRLTPMHLELLLLLSAVTTASAIVGIETEWGAVLLPPPPTELVRPATLPELDIAEPFKLKAADENIEFVLRPPFVSTRRPPPAPPPPESPKPTMRKDQFILLGTVVSPERRIAFLYEKAANKNRGVLEGRDINGVKVISVGQSEATLGQYEDTEHLRLLKGLPPTHFGVTLPPPPPLKMQSSLPLVSPPSPQAAPPQQPPQSPSATPPSSSQSPAAPATKKGGHGGLWGSWGGK
jgi:hypothetical protein